MRPTLPPRALISKPEAEDPIDFYYFPLTAALYRTRLRDALVLPGDGPFDSLIEIGYGSGAFLPELARRTKRLVGIDIHPGRESVERMVERLDLDVELLHASLFELPLADDTFDALVWNAATGLFFRLVRYDPKGIHPSSHRDIEAAIDHAPGLTIERELHFPRLLPLDLAAYAAFLCVAN